MEKVEQGDANSVTDRTDSSPSNPTCTRRRIWIALAGIVLLGGIIGISVYFATRPEFIEVTETTAEESLPSLIKVAPLGEGAILMEYTESLEDPTKLFYYVTVQDLDFESLPNVTNLENVNLYLTRAQNPTVGDVGDDSIQVQNVAQTEFPYRLPEGSLPGDLNGVLFLEEGADEARFAIVTSNFDVIVDADQNIASPLPPSPSPSSSPTALRSISPSESPSAFPSSKPSPAPSRMVTMSPTTKPSPAQSSSPSLWPSQNPTDLPSSRPTMTPTQPTDLPTRSPKPTATDDTPAPTISMSPTPSPTATKSLSPTSSPTLTSSFNPTTSQPSPSPTKKRTASPSISPTRRPTPAPTSRPTKRPTIAPSSAPVNTPTSPPLPPILISSLESEDYNIGGTISIDYISDFIDGKVVDVARLKFDIPEAASAPGPYLYLSKRPYSETKEGSLTSADIYIPIDEIGDGSFTAEGRYDQALDEISNVQDLNEYTNGSWIIWCRPFGVWLGGGPISPDVRVV